MHAVTVTVEVAVPVATLRLLGTVTSQDPLDLRKQPRLSPNLPTNCESRAT